MERKFFTFIAVLLFIAGTFVFVCETFAQETSDKLSLSTSENALMNSTNKAGAAKESKDASVNVKEYDGKEAVDKKPKDKAEKKEAGTGKTDETNAKKETPAVTEPQKAAPEVAEPGQKAPVTEPAMPADAKKAEEENKTESPFDFESYIVKSAFREIYTGNDLTSSEKGLIKLSVFFSMNDDDDKLKKEINNALDMGIKPEKIIAAFVHCSDYVKYQKVLNAVLISKKVFDERKISFENKMPEIKFE